LAQAPRLLFFRRALPMEVTVVETGDLPPSTVISFHTGSTRRHAHVEKDKAIKLSYVSGAEPIRVDLMSQVGSHRFDMVPGQDVYDVPIAKAQAESEQDVTLKFKIRDCNSDSKPSGNGAGAGGASASGKRADQEDGDVDAISPRAPSRKLQTALMMRSYLDNHDVLRQMQELLQDMVTYRPDDPIEYMIRRLEESCQDTHDVELATMEETGADSEKKSASFENADLGSDDEDEEEDCADLVPMPKMAPRTRSQSVSAEAYGAFNQRKAYKPIIIPKDAGQKKRIKDVLKNCWMFKDYKEENLLILVDAMAEKVVAPDVRLIQQGDAGEAMWVIEQGVLECSKRIDGEDKVVKTCQRGDIFGELALLYSCPRAATVVTRAKCILWELDRETFNAICYAAARGANIEYDGFSAPSRKDEDESGSDAEVPEEKPRAQVAGKRREGVSAESMKDNDDGWTPPVHAKGAEERLQLSNIIKTSRDSKLHMLFGTVSKETFEKIVDAVFLKAITIGEHVIVQGDIGDYFYIVKSGRFDIVVKKGQDPPKKVFEAGEGFAFGELALLYNAPRSATITASEPSEVWCLDRVAFRNLVVRSAEAQFRQYVEFLSGVDVFQVLNTIERAALAEVLEEEEFEEDEAIVEQDERDDKMFILRSGTAVACIKGEQGEIEVMNYKAGDYFGEIALLNGTPRKASVYAVQSCVCLYISRETFMRILGPLHNLLERNLGKYEKYQDAIKSAVAENVDECNKCDRRPSHQNQDDEFDGGLAMPNGKRKFVTRKRERPSQKQPEVDQSKILAAHKDAPEPASLAEKVAQDFTNLTLVTPSDDFIVRASGMTLFGGLKLGQKFTMDKPLVLRTDYQPTNSGDDVIYSWTQPTKLQKATEVSVVCQKGQKSAADPTPNQDNFFTQNVGNVSMYGVADGHGPFGHLVSFRLVQTLPHFLVNSPNFGKDWKEALNDAFAQAQQDLVEFCTAQNINIEASGAAGSVLVLEEQTVHIAFVGDARVMLGSWNRRDSRLIFCTTDHKPGNEGERQRLEAAGSEVREIDPGNHRIYLPGSDFPGLTMSRAFGDTACGGVLREPEYHRFLMQPTDEWYAIVASDGIWEFIEGEEACTLTAKKLRLKGTRETLNFLVNASRKRWNYCCGEYCDDITGLLVQWNSHDKKNDKANYSLTVKRDDS